MLELPSLSGNLAGLSTLGYKSDGELMYGWNQAASVARGRGGRGGGGCLIIFPTFCEDSITISGDVLKELQGVDLDNH